MVSGDPLYLRVEGHDAFAPYLASDEETLVRLGKPALLRIPGRDPARARFVSCLLHGNEDSGYRAVLRLLRRRPVFDFDVWVFIGNVRAAHQHGWFAHRYLDDQEDFNRVWGVAERTTRMRQCAAAVLQELSGAPLEAALDIHNNTGANPPYAIVPVPTQQAQALAATCSVMVVHWNRRAHTLMEALSALCPAVSVECGLPGIEEHHRYAEGALARFLAVEDPTTGPVPERVFELLATVHVRREVAFAFGGPLTDELDLVLAAGLDGHNFGTMPAGAVLGHVRPGADMPLVALDMDRTDVTARHFEVCPDGSVVATRALTPAMMVTTVQQERRDCLFYVARRLV
ncbi:MAG TPA: succinylglutamate desuccinylase/aspartoacylase family protein [Egibacteraceae bacterium]|nr:succinylglutamate desuccinylase/aspartoacylase family protein [Egibacteraceae bacterium]